MLDAVFFVLKSFLRIARQWAGVDTKFAILSLKPRSHVGTLIYRGRVRLGLCVVKLYYGSSTVFVTLALLSLAITSIVNKLVRPNHIPYLL